MGNAPIYSLALSKNQLDVNLNDYTLAQERNDERFGHVYLMRAKSSNTSLLVKEKYATQSEIRRDEVSKYLDVTSDYILKIFKIKQGSTSDEYQIFFEDFNTDLEKEIQRHLREKSRFSEGELYSILYCTISALSALEVKGLAHESLLPHNILKLSREVYKTHDNYLLVNRTTVYDYALKNEFVRYLPPELIDSYADQQATPDLHNANKLDIWCLGVAILDAALLNREGEFLNRKLNVFDEGKLKEKLKQFREHYSSTMGRILEDMLAVDPTRRPDATTLLRRLPGKPVNKTLQSSGKKLLGAGDKSKNSSPIKTERAPETTTKPLERVPSTDYLRKVNDPLINPLAQSNANFGRRDLGSLNVSNSIKNDPILSKFLNKIYGLGEEEAPVSSNPITSSTISNIPVTINTVPQTNTGNPLAESATNLSQQLYSKPSPIVTVNPPTTSAPSDFGPNPEVARIIAELKAQKAQNESTSTRIENIVKNDVLNETPRGYQPKPLSTSGLAQSSYGYNFLNAEERPRADETFAQVDTNREKIDQIFLRALTRTNENLRKSQELSSLISATNQSIYIPTNKIETLKGDWRISNTSYFDDRGQLKSGNNTGEKFFTSADQEVARLKEDIDREIAQAEAAKKEFLESNTLAPKEN